MRHITQEGLDLIKRFEGFSPTIYICPAGYPTIGYGHVVLDEEKDRFATEINQEQGEELLRRDAQVAERAVLRLTYRAAHRWPVRCPGLIHLKSGQRCVAAVHIAPES